MDLRKELVDVFRLLRTPKEYQDLVDNVVAYRRVNSDNERSFVSEEIGARIDWWLRKALPHVRFQDLFVGRQHDRSVEEDVELALKLEAEQAHLAAPPFISHEMLVDNVGFLQERARELGDPTLYVLVPFELEWPKARLGEMIWKTHVDASPEEIVEEIYRRQPEARAETGG